MTMDPSIVREIYGKASRVQILVKEDCPPEKLYIMQYPGRTEIVCPPALARSLQLQLNEWWQENEARVSGSSIAFWPKQAWKKTKSSRLLHPRHGTSGDHDSHD